MGCCCWCLHSRSKSKVSFQLAPRVSFLDCDEGTDSSNSSTAGGADPATQSTAAGLPSTGSAVASSSGTNSNSRSGVNIQGNSSSGSANNSRTGTSSQSSSGAGMLSALSRWGSTFGIAEQERAYAQRNSLEAQRGESSAGGGQGPEGSSNIESPKGGRPSTSDWQL